jgi:uncharacterized protein (UPF0335 family)
MAKMGHNSGDDPYSVTAEELTQFVERYETLESEAADIKEQMKEVLAEAKGRGYDTKILRLAMKRRKRSQDELQEEEAILQVYEEAISRASGRKEIDL